MTYLLVRSERFRDAVKRVPFLLPALPLTWIFVLAKPIGDAATSPAGQSAAHAVGSVMPPIPWGWLKAVATIWLAIVVIRFWRRHTPRGRR